MPELPEVETVVRQLAPQVKHQRLERIQVFDAKLNKRSLRRAWPSTIRQVFRSGKKIVFELELDDNKNPLYLAVHLRMTGRLIIGDEVAKLPHLRALFELEHSSVAFTDVRRFGTLTLHKDADELKTPGVDPTGDLFHKAGLAAMLEKSQQEIKVWLLRQDRIVGLGNIYASEILFDAKIHPSRTASSLNPKEITALFNSTKRILQKAIDACGTTFSDFQTAQGQEGDFGKFLKVYGKIEKPCKRCHTPIEKLIQAQRSTFFCPNCQKQARK